MNCTIATLARLEAFIATALIFLRDDGSDNFEGHQQKMCLGISTSFLPLAYNQLTDIARCFVNKRRPGGFGPDKLSVNSNNGAIDSFIGREAAIKVIILIMKRRSIAISRNWLKIMIRLR